MFEWQTGKWKCEWNPWKLLPIWKINIVINCKEELQSKEFVR